MASCCNIHRFIALFPCHVHGTHKNENNGGKEALLLKKSASCMIKSEDFLMFYNRLLWKRLKVTGNIFIKYRHEIIKIKFLEHANTRLN